MAVGAIGAQSASAGLSLFTCIKTETGEFATEHCVASDPGPKEYSHVVFTQNETHGKIHNLKTDSTTTGRTNELFKETIAGTNLELESTGNVEALGTVKNELVGGEMRGVATTNENGIVFEGVVVKAPAGKGCKVFEDTAKKEKGAEGIVKTKPVTARTTVVKDIEGGVEQERHSAIIEPVTAPIFATFFIECEKGKGVPEALEGTWTVEGKLTCPFHGATIICNHETVTTANTLKGKGAKGGLAGKFTITAGRLPETEPTHPLSVTTTTP